MTRTRRFALTWGAILWIGSAQFFIAQLVAQLAWTTPYSLLHNYISDLGNTACKPVATAGALYICSPLYQLMNVSFILLGVTLILAAVRMRTVFQPTRLRALGVTMLAIAGVGPILVGLAPENVNTTVHVGGAALQFICGNLGLLVMGVLLYRRHQTRLGLSTGIGGVIGLTALILFMVCRLSAHNLGLGVGGWERVVVYPLPIWTSLFGLGLLAKPRPTRPLAHLAA